MNFRTFCCLWVLYFLIGCSVTQQDSTTEGQLRAINFPTSVSGEAQQEFLRGVSALYDFWYPQARVHFRRAREMDPNFAMAYWGEALTHERLFWRQHDQAEGSQVLQALDQRIEAGTVKWSDREQAYVNAVRLLFEPGPSVVERRDLYASAMADLVEQYPDDQEAVVFEALAAMSVQDFNFQSENDVDPIASRLETFLDQHPNHPGALHYLIHVCDTEKFAERALPAADKFAKIAQSSHALHMPSHIYRHLAMWDKVVESNKRAYEVSVKWQQETERPLYDRDFHALSWLFDGYIELEKYEEACKIISDMDQMVAEARNRGEAYAGIENERDRYATQYREQSEGPSCNLYEL